MVLQLLDRCLRFGCFLLGHRCSAAHLQKDVAPENRNRRRKTPDARPEPPTSSSGAAVAAAVHTHDLSIAYSLNLTRYSSLLHARIFGFGAAHKVDGNLEGKTQRAPSTATGFATRLNREPRVVDDFLRAGFASLAHSLAAFSVVVGVRVLA